MKKSLTVTASDLTIEEVPDDGFDLSYKETQQANSKTELKGKDVLTGANIDELLSRRGFDSERLKSAFKTYCAAYIGLSGNNVSELNKSMTRPSDHPFYLITMQNESEEGLFSTLRSVLTHYFFDADVLTDLEYDMLHDIANAVHNSENKKSTEKDSYKPVLLHELLSTTFFKKHQKSQEVTTEKAFKPCVNLQIFPHQLYGTAYKLQVQANKYLDSRYNFDATDIDKDGEGGEYKPEDPNLSVTLAFVFLPQLKKTVDTKITPLKRALESLTRIASDMTAAREDVNDAGNSHGSPTERSISKRKHGNKRKMVGVDSVSNSTNQPQVNLITDELENKEVLGSGEYYSRKKEAL